MGALSGRTVVVTRGAGGDDALGDRLRALGAEVLEFPAIALAPAADFGPLDAALRELARFDWVAFASANAVEQAVARLDVLGLKRGLLADRRLACVGPATGARLEVLVRAPDLMPSEATGAALAAALARHVRGAAVLVPRAAEGRPELVDGLRFAGADVAAPVAYRTVLAAPGSMAGLGALLVAGRVDAVTFASPSAVRGTVVGLGNEVGRLANVLLAAIGPTTAEALREAGFAAGVVPDIHTAGALVDAIVGALAGQRGG
jgi:uroporphyrinogen-III synthase/uroporphyrinogen III methyltransferase/synthase